MTDEARQQDVLRAFRDIDDLDIVALGTRKGPDVYVVIDCPGSHSSYARIAHAAARTTKTSSS